jgi:hypothetical protein
MALSNQLAKLAVRAKQAQMRAAAAAQAQAVRLGETARPNAARSPANSDIDLAQAQHGGVRANEGRRSPRDRSYDRLTRPDST